MAMSLGAAFAGIAALAGPRRPASKQALATVDAFISGLPSRGGCSNRTISGKVPRKGEKAAGRLCDFVSDGVSLRARGATLTFAEKTNPESPVSRTIKICVGPENQTPKMRDLTNAMLRRLRAGVSVSEITARGESEWRLRGNKGKTRMQAPVCYIIAVPEDVRRASMKALSKHQRDSQPKVARARKGGGGGSPGVPGLPLLPPPGGGGGGGSMTVSPSPFVPGKPFKASPNIYPAPMKLLTAGKRGGRDGKGRFLKRS